MNAIYLRRSTPADLPLIEQVIEDGRQALKAAGSTQWQDGNPTQATLKADVDQHQSWVLLVNGQVAGVATLKPGPEDDYRTITGGHWANDCDDYVTIHRVAISRHYRGQHLSSYLFSDLLTVGQALGYTNFRIDTHQQNQVMQHLIKKFGFQYRGTVTVDDKLDPQRVDFELNLPDNQAN